MSVGLRIIEPGVLTTLQDLGRTGYQRMGVPVGGALDTVSLQAANALVGNAPGDGVLEIAYRGPTFMVAASEARLAVVGAAATIDIGDDTGKERIAVAMMQSFVVRRGQTVRIGALRGGAVAYVAVEGGFAVPPLLGSVSTCARIGLGGWHGRALTAGDILPLARDTVRARAEGRLENFALTAPPRLRVMLGPQADYFSEASLAAFFAGTYTVGADSNRMGMRLEGPVVAHARGFNITSDAVAPGSIQIPGSGQPIVLLADRQTTGGYPKIATVISADLPALGRLPIGAKVGFTPVSAETAVAARRAMRAELDTLTSRIVPVRLDAGDLTERLFTCNLISGAVDGLSSSAA